METSFIFLIGPRACGKSTVSLALHPLLPGWRHLDVDTIFQERSPTRSQLMVHAADYYEGCREIVRENLSRERVVMSMGGGTLINPQHPSGDLDLLVACKKRGPMVLLLPSRCNWRNQRILYRRESGRSYDMPQRALAKLKETTYSQYNQRIGFFRDCADLVLTGSNAERTARRIVKHYKLGHRSAEA